MLSLIAANSFWKTRNCKYLSYFLGRLVGVDCKKMVDFQCFGRSRLHGFAPTFDCYKSRDILSKRRKCQKRGGLMSHKNSRDIHESKKFREFDVPQCKISDVFGVRQCDPRKGDWLVR